MVISLISSMFCAPWNITKQQQQQKNKTKTCIILMVTLLRFKLWIRAYYLSIVLLFAEYAFVIWHLSFFNKWEYPFAWMESTAIVLFVYTFSLLLGLIFALLFHFPFSTSIYLCENIYMYIKLPTILIMIILKTPVKIYTIKYDK